MDVIVLGAAIVIFTISIYIFLKRSAAAGLSDNNLSLLKTENDSLKIALAKAEERAAGIFTEKENLTRLFKDDQARLLDELLYERSQLAQANQSLESSRSYFKAQQEKLAEQKEDIESILFLIR